MCRRPSSGLDDALADCGCAVVRDRGRERDERSGRACGLKQQAGPGAEDGATAREEGNRLCGRGGASGGEVTYEGVIAGAGASRDPPGRPDHPAHERASGVREPDRSRR